MTQFDARKFMRRCEPDFVNGTKPTQVVIFSFGCGYFGTTSNARAIIHLGLFVLSARVA